MDNQALLQIIWVIAGLAVLWVVLRFVLRLTMKVFSCGCGAILALGILLAIINFLS
jgi:hypothetical protein